MKIKAENSARIVKDLDALIRQLQANINAVKLQTKLVQNCKENLDPRSVTQSVIECKKEIVKVGAALDHIAGEAKALLKGGVSKAMKDDLAKMETLHDRLWKQMEELMRELDKLAGFANRRMTGVYGTGGMGPVNELIDVAFSILDLVARYLKRWN